MLSNLPYYNQNGRNMQQMTNDTYRSRGRVRSENKYRHNGMTISKKYSSLLTTCSGFFFFLLALA